MEKEQQSNLSCSTIALGSKAYIQLSFQIYYPVDVDTALEQTLNFWNLKAKYMVTNYYVFVGIDERLMHVCAIRRQKQISTLDDVSCVRCLFWLVSRG